MYVILELMAYEMNEHVEVWMNVILELEWNVKCM